MISDFDPIPGPTASSSSFSTRTWPTTPTSNGPNGTWPRRCANGGATVHAVRLPPGLPPEPDGTPAKVGFDDFLVVNGLEAFAALLRRQAAAKPKRPNREDSRPNDHRLDRRARDERRRRDGPGGDADLYQRPIARAVSPNTYKPNPVRSAGPPGRGSSRCCRPACGNA